MSLKAIEKGILEGDWAKVIKGYNSITGSKLKLPTLKGTKMKPIVKTVKKVVYKTDPSIEKALEFYADKSNYGVKGTAIPILMDGGEKARSVEIVVDESEDEDEQEQPKLKKVKSVGSRKVRDNELTLKIKKDKKGVEVIEIDDDDDKTPFKKGTKKKRLYREPDNSRDIIQFPCSRCGRQKPFRRFETIKGIQNEMMDVICNGCIVNGR